MTKRGIMLMNLGSPDSTEVKDVQRYLNEFLMDKRVIDYPWLLRKILIEMIITPKRAPRSAEAYKSVWLPEGSPLIVLSKQLRDFLQENFEEPVELSMRYGNPHPEVAYENLMKRNPGLEEVIAIPLYPHYAMSSFETAVEYAKEVHRKNKYPFKLTFIKPFYSQEDYIHALAKSMEPFLQEEYDQILFSYHSIPRRHITKGDVTGTHCLKVENCCEVNSPAHAQCYRHQCLRTTKLVMEALNIPKEKYSVSFQSRLGREEWLKPYTALKLSELPSTGIKKLVVVCPSFVSDCLETLEEIAVEGKELFLHAGGEKFTLIPCLNTHPLLIETITGWVRNYEKGSMDMILA
ncbi:MAG: ferrochelatase [Chitinophagaceae bacterium]|nr:MAG: ferrochelatase [Chitinophagaceae bacterium]